MGFILLGGLGQPWLLTIVSPCKISWHMASGEAQQFGPIYKTLLRPLLSFPPPFPVLFPPLFDGFGGLKSAKSYFKTSLLGLHTMYFN